MPKTKFSDLMDRDVQEGLKAVLTTMKEIVKEQQRIARARSSSLKAGGTGSVAGFKKVEKEIAEVNALTRENERLKKEQLRLNARLKTSETNLAKGVQETRNQLNKNTAALRNNTKRRQAAIGSVERLRATLNEARRRWDNLSKAERENAKVGGRLNRVIQNTEAQVRKLELATGRAQRNVGNYTGALGKLTNGLRSAARTAATFFGIFAAVRVIRSSIKIFRDFEKGQAVLAGVLDKARESTRELTKDAIRLGSVTAKTASEVGKLQVAFARLGFSQKEIIALTEPTINGSIALNASLEETAGLVGAIVNTFDDFEAVDAPLILDQLTSAAQNSALEFDKLQTAIPIVAGAANAAGIPFTKLVALLGKLADSGIDASMSATALRNIFIESASQGLDFDKILKKIRDSQDKLTAANDEFGKRAAVSSTVLASNLAGVQELDEALQSAGGTAERVANEQLNTLDGAILLLTSAWEGFILRLNESSGAGKSLQITLKFIARNLTTILKIAALAASAFVAYRLSIIAVAIAQKAAAAAQILFNTSVTVGTRVMQVFNTVTKLNPIGLLVTVLTTAAIAFGFFSDEADKATESQEELNDAVLEGQRILASVKDIATRVKTVERLGKKQLKSLIADIDTEIKAAQDKQAAIIASEESAQIESEKIIQDNVDARKAAFDEFGKLEGLGAQRGLDFQLERTIQEEKTANEIIVIAQGVTKAKIDEELKQLEAFRRISEAQLNIRRDIAKKETAEEKAARLKREREDLANLKRFLELQKLDDQRIENASKARLELAKLIAFTEEDMVKAVIAQRNKDLDDLNLTEDESILIITKATKEIGDIRQDFRDKEKAAKDKAAEDDKERLDKLATQRKDQLEAAKIFAEELVALQRDASNERIKIIDDDIRASENRARQLQRLAERQSENATENLAFEQKKQAELRQEREKELRRQKQAEFGLAALQTFTAKVEAGDPNALTSTIRDLTLLTQFIRSIPAFFEGTDDTGVGGRLDSKGGRVSILHDNEQVWSKQNVKDGGGRTRAEAIDVLQSYDNDILTSSSFDAPLSLHRFESNDSILEKFDSLEIAVRESKIEIPKISWEFDAQEQAIIKTVKTQLRTNRYHKKVGRLF